MPKSQEEVGVQEGQSHHLGNEAKGVSTQKSGDLPGHPPQPDGAKHPMNTAAPGVPFYTPLSDPPPGTAFGVKPGSLPLLFTPWKTRSVTFKNRIIASPMCQYSAATGTGMPTDWHLVHQGQFSIRGVALVFTEACSVTPDGLISPEDLGIWSDEHIPAYKRMVDFHHSQGAKAGLQICHAGRKASTYAPWLTDGLISPKPDVVQKSVHVPKDIGGWEVRGPSTIPFAPTYPKPREMTLAEFNEIKQAFVDAAIRADKAGYDVLELHGAHGYLMSAILSPVSNVRTDKYGGSLENRMRFPLEVTEAVRSVWPHHKPLFFRISATEWHEDGEGDAKSGWKSWGIEQTRILAGELKKRGVDFMDVSSGGNYAKQDIPIGPGYQVPFARALKQDPALKGLLIGSVGLITDGKQAEEILQKGEADAVLLARELLRHADFVTDAANDLGTVVAVANQYQRAHTRMFKRLESDKK